MPLKFICSPVPELLRQLVVLAENPYEQRGARRIVHQVHPHHTRVNGRQCKLWIQLGCLSHPEDYRQLALAVYQDVSEESWDHRNAAMPLRTKKQPLTSDQQIFLPGPEHGYSHAPSLSRILKIPFRKSLKRLYMLWVEHLKRCIYNFVLSGHPSHAHYQVSTTSGS